MPPANNQYPTPTQPAFDPGLPVPKPKHHLNGLLIPFILSVVLLIGVIGFAAWAFMSRQDYKNNSDAKSAVAVKAAEKATTEANETNFLEREKEPLQEYKSPDAFGAITVKYPKTWSAYVNEVGKGNLPVDGYFHPNFVPGVDSGTAFALRLEVTEEDYSVALKKFETLTKAGKVKVSPIAAKNVADIIGSRIDGEISAGKQGSVVLFPVRDKTLRLSSEAQQFGGDFNDIILTNLTFSP